MLRTGDEMNDISTIPELVSDFFKSNCYSPGQEPEHRLLDTLRRY